MKKIITLILSILILSLLTSACGSNVDSSKPNDTDSTQQTDEQINKDEIYGKIDKAYIKNENYAVSLKGYLSSTVNDKAIISNIEGKIVSYRDGNGYVYQEYAKNHLEYDGEKSDNVIIYGYQNGYLYTYNKDENGLKKFSSEISENEYLEYQDSLTDDVSFSLENGDFKVESASKGENGEWTVMLNQFSYENLVKLSGVSGAQSSMFDKYYKISDVNVIITADKDYNAKKVKLEYQFERVTEGIKDAQPCGITPIYYMEFELLSNENISVAESLDPSHRSFVQTDALTSYYKAVNELNKIKQAQSGEFDLIIKITSESGTVKSEQETSGAYEIKDGKLSYKTESDGVIVEYANGKKNTYAKGENEAGRNEDVSELEARALLESYLDAGTLSACMGVMMKMEKRDDNKFRFTFNPDQSALKKLESVYGAEVSIHTCDVTVEFDTDGKIKEYTYRLGISVVTPISSNQYVVSSVTQSYICTYQY